MKKGRMLKWAALLDQVPREKFDMGMWAQAAVPISNEPRCATKACALGWATAIPAFNRAGLHLIAAERDGRLGMVRFKGRSNDKACAAFFGLTSGQAYGLCFSGDDDPKQKARDIRAMVARAR